jgi:hypothetical protein
MNTYVITSKIITVLLIAIISFGYAFSLFFLDFWATGTILLIVVFLFSKFTVLSTEQIVKSLVIGGIVGTVPYMGLVIWDDWEFFVKFGFTSGIR